MNQALRVAPHYVTLCHSAQNELGTLQLFIYIKYIKSEYQFITRIFGALFDSSNRELATIVSTISGDSPKSCNCL